MAKHYAQPPPYPQAQPIPGYATTPNQSYGQQPLAPRTLHVYAESWTHRHARILDSDKRTPLYHVDMNSAGLFSSKPHIKVNVASTGAQIGTVTLHSMSSDMDMTVHNQPIALGRAGFLSSAYEFNSLATGGTLKWKRDGMFTTDMVCIDQREQVFARFLNSNWAVKKEGKFELGPGVTGPLMDEIVTSGIAVEYRRRQNSSAASGRGGVS